MQAGMIYRDYPRLRVYYIGPNKEGLPSHRLVEYVIRLGIEVSRIDRAPSQKHCAKATRALRSENRGGSAINPTFSFSFAQGAAP